MQLYFDSSMTLWCACWNNLIFVLYTVTGNKAPVVRCTAVVLLEVVDMSLPKLGFGFRFSFNKIWFYYVKRVVQSTLCIIISLYRGVKSVDAKKFFQISGYQIYIYIYICVCVCVCVCVYIYIYSKLTEDMRIFVLRLRELY